MDEIIKKYSGKLLGTSGYSDLEYNAEILANLKEMPWILGEVNSHESFLTFDGILFLEEYYGFETLAKILEEDGGLDADTRDKKSILQWLIEQKKYLEEESSL